MFLVSGCKNNNSNNKTFLNDIFSIKNFVVTIPKAVTIKLPKKFGLPLIPDAICLSGPYLNINLDGVYI
mgnify:CR=1 FL=1